MRPIPPTAPADQKSATMPQTLDSIERGLEEPVNGQVGWFDALTTHKVSRVTSADLGLATDTDNDRARKIEIDNSCDLVKVSQRSWHDVRKYVGLNQAKLHARAVGLYAPSWRLPQTPMLCQPSWLPDVPIALEDMSSNGSRIHRDRLSWARNPQFAHCFRCAHGDKNFSAIVARFDISVRLSCLKTARATGCLVRH